MNFRISSRKIFVVVIVFISLVANTQSNAQSNYEDIVYLKNGSVIHGMIIEQIPNESIRIKSEKNIFVFKMDEILKITKEEVSPATVPTPVPVPEKTLQEKKIPVQAKSKDHGYVNILEFTFGRDILHNHSNAALTGSATANPQLSIGIQDINGYRFNRFFSAGVGFGIHVYPGLFYLPVFADLRIRFNKEGVTPFLSAEAGYSFTQMEVWGFESSKDYYGGLLLNPAFGVKFPVKTMFAFIMSFGYRYQEADIYTHNTIFHTSHQYKTDSYQSQTLGYINFKVGFEF